ncbi:MAG: hypothetical protein LBS55_08690 [Prevotellaceae bacterium]|jgi:hypothetical protein|nr:hypothetical protein [Prevotellaceae bacterium]
MTNVLDLFKGVGVIIDDDLDPAKGNVSDKIISIKRSFVDRNISVLEYYELPNDKVRNFHSVSFLLLDWDLIGLEQGIDLPQVAIADNIEFIKQFNSVSFAPIFIFSNENPDEIKLQLSDFGLYDDAKSNNIFVKSKSDFESIDLFTAIEEWLKQTPSIYVLKEWELALQQAKNSLFWDFYNISPNWVKVFHDTTTKDKTSLSYEMGELLFENLKTRCVPVEFDNDIVSNQNPDIIISPDEIKQVLEGQRFRKKENTPDNMIFTGDVFFKDSKYYINVRPQCDCIPREESQTINDVNLYLIEGEEKSDLSRLNFNKKTGTFNDTEIRFTIFPINQNKAIQFDLGKFSILTYDELRENRIGTLLPPFITKLVQKYALYMKQT